MKKYRRDWRTSIAPCQFCGHGKYRLMLRKAICAVIGHDLSKDTATDGCALSECYRCFLMVATITKQSDKEMIQILREPYREWRSSQSKILSRSHT